MSFLRCLLPLLLTVATVAAATLPSGFEEVQIAGGLDPVSLACSPDGRVFVLEKPGRVRVVKQGTMLSQAFLDISGQVDNFNERGLLGITFDPQFASNGWVYLFYTARSPSRNRVSRFTAAGDVAVAGSELVLIDLETLGAGNHNGGGIAFGDDGKLYVAQGENANGANAQNLGNRQGKVLRINRDGSIPTDNPWFTAGDPVRSALYAIGLRNPFAMSARSGTGRIYINDVGAGSWEEVNQLVAGANYGWPNHEGMAGSSSLANYRNPEHAYDHGVGYCITGGGFYAPSAPGPNAFPAAYTGSYFFSDYSGWIRRIDPANPGTRIAFASGINRALDVEAAPDGTLWYLARSGIGGGSDADNTSSSNGTLWQVRYTANVQVATRLGFVQQPTAVAGGVVIAPAVRVAVQDAAGATVAGSTIGVTVQFAANPGSGSLTGTLSRAAVNGIATFDDLRIATPGAGYSLRASATSLTSATSATFAVLAQVSVPVIAPGAGSYSGPVTVVLSSPTEGATIRYTVDGSTPGAGSPEYSGPFVLSATATVRAIAERSGMITSTAASAAVTITGSTPYGLPYRERVTGLDIPAAGATAASLSASGLFADLATLAARPGLIPFTVNSPLWSDNAQKLRWMALPGDTTIGYAATGEWTWPSGSVFVKHFEIDLDDGLGVQMRRLETRVMVVDGDGSYGLTYRWRGDGSDADLVSEAGQDEVLAIAVPGGGVRNQTWHYPSRSECMQCHTPTAGRVLGPKTRQLNGSYGYSGGISDNQLRAWNHVRLFDQDIGEGTIGGLARMVPVDDGQASLETRVRSYLDANCAGCHRPGGTPAAWDARFDTPLDQTGIINGTVRDALGIAGARVVVPGASHASILLVRMNSTAATVRMPPLGRNVVHTAAVDAVSQWINGLPAGLPAPWVSADVGGPALAGSASGSGSSFTVSGSGADIWNAADQFQFAFQPLAGDGTIIARVDSLQNTDPWAKAGVMLRASLAADAPFAMAVVTSGNGAAMQWRTSAGGQAANAGQGGVAAPYWVRLVRSGTEVAASTAPDASGTPGAWTAIGAAQTFTGGEMLVGLALTSHNNDVISTATFSGVAVTTPPAAVAVRINFQPAGSSVPAGYLVDAGEIYAGRNGQSYGWLTPITDTSRDRNVDADQRYDTLVHLQKPTVPDAVWELAVPNGSYQVHAVSGDPQNFDGSYHLLAEGVTVLQATPSSSVRFFDGTATVTVTDGRLTVRSGPTAQNNKLCFIEVQPVPTAFAARINFQPAGAPVPAGYLADTGEVYAARNGQSYGWLTPITDTSRDRNIDADQRYDTLVHLQKPTVPDAVWELAVPNGSYQVYAVSGDPQNFDGSYHLLAEGLSVLQATPSANVRFFDGTATMTVTDGRLTIRSGSTAVNNKLCFIEVQSVPVSNQ